jgi:hypothetical protein
MVPPNLPVKLKLMLTHLASPSRLFVPRMRLSPPCSV